MPTVFNTHDTVFFVGGRGAKTGDALAGGGATKEAWEGALGEILANVMGVNGTALSASATWGGSKTACTVTNNGSGKLRITRDSGFADCNVGLIANVAFLAVYTDGRYEVTAVNDNYVDIDYAYSADTTCDIIVGGAFNKIETAVDNTTASAGSPHNVDILTNKNETFTAAGDQIYFDTGGGSGSANTWKRIIGVDDDGVELVKGSYVELNGNGQTCHILVINNIENIELRHIYAVHTLNTYYGFYITAADYCQGFLLRDCKSTDCKYAVYSDTNRIRGITIIGGHYSSATGPALYLNGSRWVFVIGTELAGSLAGTLIDGDVVGTLVVDGCVLYKTGNFVGGVYTDNWDTFLIVRNCVFYNIDDCIKLNDPDSRLVQYNNIFVLHTAATGKIINRIAGAIKYSDYSCAWALDGAPAASGRWGEEDKPANAIEVDPQFVDVDSGDFRLREPKVLRGGRRDIAGNVTQMGAVLQKYQFDRRAKTANLGRLQIMR